jgi:hypothetical protein
VGEDGEKEIRVGRVQQGEVKRADARDARDRPDGWQVPVLVVLHLQYFSLWTSGLQLEDSDRNVGCPRVDGMSIKVTTPNNTTTPQQLAQVLEVILVLVLRARARASCSCSCSYSYSYSYTASRMFTSCICSFTDFLFLASTSFFLLN